MESVEDMIKKYDEKIRELGEIHFRRIEGTEPYFIERAYAIAFVLNFLPEFKQVVPEEIWRARGRTADLAEWNLRRVYNITA